MKKRIVSVEGDFDLSNVHASNLSSFSELEDKRIFENGQTIPTVVYCDQPKIVILDDGSWLCVITTGLGMEGEPGQHIITMRSYDKGRTWVDRAEIEDPHGPDASYATLLQVPSGRVYCFYNYNEDDIKRIPIADPDLPINRHLYPDGYCYRVDSCGYHVYRYSDDNGKTWSDKRYHVDIRETEIDRNNSTGGKIKYFWNVSSPYVYDNKVYISLHKVGNFGDGFFTSNEGWQIMSPNMAYENDPAKIEWVTLPEGEIGLRAPKGGARISSEQSYAVLADGTFFSVYRTHDGYSACSYSHDMAKSWEEPQYMRYCTGKRIKHPSAANFIWKLRNGYYLYWFHNNGGEEARRRMELTSACSGFDNRNPVWISLAKEIKSDNGSRLLFSQPEVILYAADPINRLSYPDLVQEYDSDRNLVLYLASTQKNTAKINKVDMRIIHAMETELSCYDDYGRYEGVSSSLDCLDEHPILSWRNGDDRISEIPFYSPFNARDIHSVGYGAKSLRQGLTFIIDGIFVDNGRVQCLFDTVDNDNRGFRMLLDDEFRLRLEMGDGQTFEFSQLEKGILKNGAHHKVACIVDGGARIVSWIVDGVFCDGGSESVFGWSRFSSDLWNMNTLDRIMSFCSRRNDSAMFAGTLESIDIYNDYLLTSEVLQLQRQ